MLSVTLYSRSIDGKIKYWGQEIKVSASNTVLLVTSYGAFGLKGTIQQQTVDTADCPEEVTPIVESTKLLLLSNLSHKQREGYKTLAELGIKFETTHNCYCKVIEGTNKIYHSLKEAIEENLPQFNVDKHFNPKPMKCQTFKKDTIIYPVIGQPKLNGIRCFARRNNDIKDIDLFTRDDNVILSSKLGLSYIMPHITTELDLIYSHPSFRSSLGVRNLDANIVNLDGELYNHGLRLNEIRASVATKNDKGTISKPSGNPLDIKYYIFDIACNIPQSERIAILKVIQLIILELKFNHVVVVENIEVTSDYYAKMHRDLYIAAGYEGVILRDPNAPYKFGQRSKHIHKYKAKQDGEFKILDIILKDDAQEGRTYITFLLKNDINDSTFESTPKGNEKERREYLDNKQLYIGKNATVVYYERSGVEEVPFHSNVITIRDYE